MKTAPLWIQRYRPPTTSMWQGRSDGRFHEAIHCIDLRSSWTLKVQQPTFALLGFACDQGIKRNLGRVGAANGPTALRKALAKLPIHCNNLLTVYDVGDIQCIDDNLEETQLALAEVVALLLRSGLLPLVVGGGHEVAWGHYRGISTAFLQKSCAIVNCDAHLDMRPLLEGTKGTSGTSFLQIAQDRQEKGLPFDYTCIGVQQLGNTTALFDTAKQWKTTIISADTLHTIGAGAYLDDIQAILSRTELVYLSVCMDVFAAPFAPGVSAPQPFGLLPWHLTPLLTAFASSKKVIGFDIAELSPPFDEKGTTAQLAATLISIYLHAHEGLLLRMD